jgi:hypothetical protein
MFFVNFDLDVLIIPMEWESPPTGDRRVLLSQSRAIRTPADRALTEGVATNL